jgi:hypothetical protein
LLLDSFDEEAPDSFRPVTIAFVSAGDFAAAVGVGAVVVVGAAVLLLLLVPDCDLIQHTEPKKWFYLLSLLYSTRIYIPTVILPNIRTSCFLRGREDHEERERERPTRYDSHDFCCHSSLL